jgi:hypothetical protein
MAFLHSLLFSPDKITTPNGDKYEFPSLFRFCFEVLDFGDKEFMCEHDIMQFMM